MSITDNKEPASRRRHCRLYRHGNKWLVMYLRSQCVLAVCVICCCYPRSLKSASFELASRDHARAASIYEWWGQSIHIIASTPTSMTYGPYGQRIAVHDNVIQAWWMATRLNGRSKTNAPYAGDLAVGWPIRFAACSWESDLLGQVKVYDGVCLPWREPLGLLGSPILPLRLNWHAAIVNSSFYCILYSTVAITYKLLRCRLRQSRGLCGSC